MLIKFLICESVILLWEAHVVTSSVMRLIHKMGYDSYTDFKEYIIDKKELEKGSSNTAIPFSLDIFSNGY